MAWIDLLNIPIVAATRDGMPLNRARRIAVIFASHAPFELGAAISPTQFSTVLEDNSQELDAVIALPVVNRSQYEINANSWGRTGVFSHYMCEVSRPIIGQDGFGLPMLIPAFQTGRQTPTIGGMVQAACLDATLPDYFLDCHNTVMLGAYAYSNVRNLDLALAFGRRAQEYYVPTYKGQGELAWGPQYFPNQSIYKAWGIQDKIAYLLRQKGGGTLEGLPRQNLAQGQNPHGYLVGKRVPHAFALVESPMFPLGDLHTELLPRTMPHARAMVEDLVAQVIPADLRDVLWHIARHSNTLEAREAEILLSGPTFRPPPADFSSLRSKKQPEPLSAEEAFAFGVWDAGWRIASVTSSVIPFVKKFDAGLANAMAENVRNAAKLIAVLGDIGNVNRESAELGASFQAHFFHDMVRIVAPRLREVRPAQPRPDLSLQSIVDAINLRVAGHVVNPARTSAIGNPRAAPVLVTPATRRRHNRNNANPRPLDNLADLEELGDLIARVTGEKGFLPVAHDGVVHLKDIEGVKRLSEIARSDNKTRPTNSEADRDRRDAQLAIQQLTAYFDACVRSNPLLCHRIGLGDVTASTEAGALNEQAVIAMAGVLTVNLRSLQGRTIDMGHLILALADAARDLGFNREPQIEDAQGQEVVERFLNDFDMARTAEAYSDLINGPSLTSFNPNIYF
jgi:hypothetical protein